MSTARHSLARKPRWFPSASTQTARRRTALRPRPCLLCSQRPFILNRASPQASSRQFTSSGSTRVEKESIQPQTHYDFFPTATPNGAPPRGPFQIDLQRLRKEFLQMQATAHPDRHPAEKKARAEALSARINEAYKTLQDPLRRAQYILSLRGIDVAEDETAKVDDATLLMEVMEARETIENAQEEADLADIRTQNEARLGESISSLDRAFKDDDLDTAKTEAVKLRYWTNIQESINNWEPGEPVVLVH